MENSQYGGLFIFTTTTDFEKPEIRNDFFFLITNIFADYHTFHI